MATLMQKDVLLEVAASTTAKIFHARGKTVEEQRIADRKDVADRKNRFYSTKPENLNYLNELAALKEIKQKYEVINS
jgi:hypothetical protein